MSVLTTAHQELFRRQPDECFPTFGELAQFCAQQRENSIDLWERPQKLSLSHDLTMAIGDNPDYQLNDWSFSQLCRMAKLNKETINRLSLKTASRAFEETLPDAKKPLQVMATDNQVRSVHGVAYTRLWNTELLDVVQEYAAEFHPAQQAGTGGTGLYCGEQDMFCFLIDPTGWVEIEEQAFAPGFFLWNSEVGRRSVGMQSFWFQKICANHIVWDAIQVKQFKQKHTANVGESLVQVREMIEDLTSFRDKRRDQFYHVIAKAMREHLGDSSEEILKCLKQQGIPHRLSQEALAIAKEQGALTLFSLVDALTKLSQNIRYAGDRTTLDQKVGRLLSLVA